MAPQPKKHSSSASDGRPLVLVPTIGERERLAALGATPTEWIGFGPVAAAARTAQLLEKHAPAHVLLIGIAGSYDPARLAVGTAHAFAEFLSWGIGAGSGADHVGPREMGFAQVPETATQTAIWDRLAGASGTGALVTVPSASASANDIAPILKRYPEALAEDMEAFAVATACSLANIPFHCVRGISNRAGNRDSSSWRIDEALAAAWELARTTFPELCVSPA